MLAAAGTRPPSNLAPGGPRCTLIRQEKIMLRTLAQAAPAVGGLAGSCRGLGLAPPSLPPALHLLLRRLPDQLVSLRQFGSGAAVQPGQQPAFTPLLVVHPKSLPEHQLGESLRLAESLIGKGSGTARRADCNEPAAPGRPRPRGCAGQIHFRMRAFSSNVEYHPTKAATACRCGAQARRAHTSRWATPRGSPPPHRPISARAWCTPSTTAPSWPARSGEL